ncbi:hypothetical protein [Natrarchaeobius oligotrophus]|uniref:Uncharacterized protein n=1 Tax=Natrarchaeobius chitinivorans TaxID=1679083 RepID=A0A3N6MX99_NATCH|nr:hypothetical protein [Natrarchaeobius chitinivorans]RQH02641.1 hypothetical protein EA472_04920 [Natrarchaeobius chitinivorans]
MSPLLAQNQTADSGIMATVRKNAVYRLLDTIRNSAALTVTFWGAVMTAIAFVVQDGVWAGIIGVWGISMLVFGGCWYAFGIWYLKPSRPQEEESASVLGRVDLARASGLVVLPALTAVYAGYVTSALSLELVAAPVAFVVAVAYLYTRSTGLETLGHGMYVLGLTVFLTPFVFHFGAIPQSAQAAGIRIDHMLALGSILFTFTVIAFLVTLTGYFLNNRSKKKADQQRLKARMGLD